MAGEQYTLPKGTEWEAKKEPTALDVIASAATEAAIGAMQITLVNKYQLTSAELASITTEARRLLATGGASVVSLVAVVMPMALAFKAKRDAERAAGRQPPAPIVTVTTLPPSPYYPKEESFYTKPAFYIPAGAFVGILLIVGLTR